MSIISKSLMWNDDNNMLQCICQGIMKLKNQPTIELLCLEDALITESHNRLTQEKYEHFMSIYTHKENNVYNTNHKSEFDVGEIIYQDLTKEQIDAFQNKTSNDETILIDDGVLVRDSIENVPAPEPSPEPVPEPSTGPSP